MDLRALALSLLAAAGALPAAAQSTAPAAGEQGAAAVAAVASAPSTASASAPAPRLPSVELGRRAYTSYCVRCHGINLAVGSSAFFDLRTFPSGDKARYLRSVRQGLRAMPAWEGIVKPDELESIWLYIGSVNGWPSG